MTIADLRSRMNRGAEGFLRWWGAALADCVPARLRAGLTSRPSALLLCPEAGGLAVRVLRRGRLREAGSVALPASGRTVAPLVRALGRHEETWLCLPASAVLRTVVDLPGAVAENLREVVGFELDRLSPFDAANARFACRVLGGDPPARTIRVELTVVARVRVDEALESVRVLGFEPDRVSVMPPDGPAGSWPDLAAGDEPGEEGRAGGWTTRGLAAVAALLLVALAVVPLHVERARLAELEARVEGVRARALEVDALERRLAGRDEEIHRLVALKTGRPGVTQLLDEVTRRLPDDTWVVQFALRDGRITLAGFSAAASALVAPLEASALLREVRFGAPVYTDPQVGLERFTLSAMVESRVEAGTARDGE